MANFEEQLRQAMKRQSPGADFTHRVLAAAARPDEQNSNSRWRQWARWTHTWRLVPVVLALLMIGGGMIYQQHEREARGEAAKQKLLVAMRIAGSKLNQTRDRILEVEVLEELQQ